MEITVAKAWNLLDRIRNNRETWSFDIGNEGGLKVEHDCIKAFLETGKIENMADDFHLDSDIISHIVQSFTDHIKAPKQGWTGYKKDAIENLKPTKETSRCAYIDAPSGPLEERPPYEEPLPFRNTMRKHMMAYEAKQRAKTTKTNQCTLEVSEEGTKGPEKLMFPNCNIVGFEQDVSRLIEGKVKSKDVGKPLLPCSFGGVSYYGLCDLGSDINVIPYTVYQEI